ncbi:MAG: hypothetical protein AABZ55_06315 [Bdellovibrionota bacterium]
MTRSISKLNTFLTRLGMQDASFLVWRTIGWIRLILIVWIFLCIHQPVATLAKEKKEKVIDFEESLVEGMNKKPLDSLNQISEAERRRRRSHLYRKRAGFTTETYETVRTLRNVQ